MSAYKGLRDLYPYFLANKAVTTTVRQALPVIDKFSGKVAAHVSAADAAVIETALQRGAEAEAAMKALPSFERKEILHSVAAQLKQRADEIAHTITVEMGKPIRDSRVEVARAVDVFTLAAEEAVRRSGEFAPMDISMRNKGFTGITSRFPAGLVSMITPFNFPVNLAAHKIAPAIAAGCPFVLKPADKTPISSSILGEILATTSLPPGAFSILPCHLADAAPFSTDPRVKVLSFTGSVEVGWKLKALAGKKKVALELGGDAAVIVDKDVASLDAAVERIVFGAFYQSGQSCISVQRIYLHDDLYDAARQKLADKAAQLKKGPPADPDTFLGPLISQREAERVESWVADAVAKGARVVCGGRRDGSYFDATILENVPANTPLSCKEVFGPVCVLYRFSDFKEVCERVNDSAYGLQAGVFTQDLHKAFYAFDKLHVGGVLINEIPSARVDSQPYGGIKDSGVGREGIRYAMEDFTEIKVMLLKDVGKLD
eukprot:TRINITY_DN7852_c0_g1_i1.p1 TRINITY_DN7852_c0_g1~~TRINITY_DN7852_c0_g1_i1.p1  ORF type:complete len:488 (+),score=197.87 TRINITY_DN7852_c0_g1_i1:967-2430(+)